MTSGMLLPPVSPRYEVRWARCWAPLEAGLSVGLHSAIGTYPIRWASTTSRARRTPRVLARAVDRQGLHPSALAEPRGEHRAAKGYGWGNILWSAGKCLADRSGAGRPGPPTRAGARCPAANLRNARGVRPHQASRLTQSSWKARSGRPSTRGCVKLETRSQNTVGRHLTLAYSPLRPLRPFTPMTL